MKRLKDIWDLLPESHYLHKYVDKKTGIKMYEVCGKKFPETAKLEYVLSILKKFEYEYGHRSRLASETNSYDWKSISHAIRAAIQVKELLTAGTITFPLKEADFLRKVKVGELDYKTVVAPHLETLMDELEILSAKSSLPEEVDKAYWDIFVIDMICYYYNLTWKEPC